MAGSRDEVERRRKMREVKMSEGGGEVVVAAESSLNYFSFVCKFFLCYSLQVARAGEEGEERKRRTGRKK